MLTRFFARRYLFSPKSRSVINVIAGVSVLSFAMPVAAMIVLLSVLNGFGDFAKSMSSAFDADLTVAPREGQTFASAEIDSLALTRVKGVGVVSYLLEQQVLLERDGLQTMATLRGVDDRYTEVFPIEETIPLGSWSVRTGPTGAGTRHGPHARNPVFGPCRSRRLCPAARQFLVVASRRWIFGAAARRRRTLLSRFGKRE